MPERMKDYGVGDIDRELSRLLAIQPPPEFAARVRTRIQQETRPVYPWTLWTLASMTAAALIVIAVVSITWKPAVPAPDRAGLHAGRTPADVYLSPDVFAAPPDRSERSPRPHVGRVQRGSRSSRRVDLELLIDPSVGRAVRRLAMEQPVLPEAPPEASLAPVVVEPLRVPDVPEIGGVRLDPGRHP